MLRWIAAVLVAAAVAGGFLAWRAGSDAPPAAEETFTKGDYKATGHTASHAAGDAGAVGRKVGGADEGRDPLGEVCRTTKAGEEGEIKIGGFERPGDTPPYEVLESERNARECAHGAHLLVDTRSKDEAGYELITRDIKARYADLDAVSVEFTDTTGVLDYEGASLIFNTPVGAYYAGFIYGPPNNKGYLVQVAD